MAVPKKRRSKSKKNTRKANWKRKSYSVACKALALGKSVMRKNPSSFIYIVNPDSVKEEPKQEDK